MREGDQQLRMHWGGKWEGFAAGDAMRGSRPRGVESGLEGLAERTSCLDALHGGVGDGPVDGF